MTLQVNCWKNTWTETRDVVD